MGTDEDKLPTFCEEDDMERDDSMIRRMIMILTGRTPISGKTLEARKERKRKRKRERKSVNRESER